MGIQASGNPDTEDRVLKRATELLYVVRSNIAHGEKTLHGPDTKQRERDETVCSVVVPLQRILFDLLLERPSRRLVAYGTLAPGQANHQVVAGLSGNWETCTLRGSIEPSRDLPVFSWNPGGMELDAHLFTSSQLPNSWARIDAFEGEAYKRRLVPARTETGIAIANVYLASRDR